MSEPEVILNRDESLTIGKQQDCAPVLEQNKLERDGNTFNTKNNYHKAASIPTILIDKWCKEWGCSMHQLLSEPEFKLKLYRRLNDPEYRALRTDTGMKL